MKNSRIKIIKGTNPILISAPHTRPIIKKDRKKPYVKLGEARVEEVLKEVCMNAGAWGIFITGNGKVRNWDEKLWRAYQKQAEDLIRRHNITLFFDIHGAKASRPFVVDYDFKMPHLHKHDIFVKHTLLKHLTRAFPNKRLSSGFFQTHNGIGNDTMTYFIRKNIGIPAIQLEVNKKVRVNKVRRNAFIKTLTKIINDYAVFIKKDKKMYEDTLTRF